MKTVDVTDRHAELRKCAGDARKEPVILVRRGRPVAALVAIENADLETVTLSNHPRFLALIERSRKRQRREGGLTPEEVRKRLGLKTSPARRRKA